MTHEVTSLFLPYIIGMVTRAGIDAAPHLRGLAIENVRPLPGRRVDWNDVAVFLNRATASLNEEEVEGMGELYVGEHTLMQAAARVIMPPRRFLRFGARIGTLAYRHLHAPIDDEPDGRVRQAFSIPHHYEGCLPFFRANVGEFRTLTELWGLGPSRVEARVTPWHGEYLITLPEGADETTWPPVSQRIRHEFTTAMEHLVGAADSRGQPADVLRLQRQHGLTRAEARVVARLAAGLEVSAIAAELRVSVETVRSHLKRAYAKTGTNRQAELVRLVLLDAEAPGT